jgi:hypothetical protein
VQPDHAAGGDRVQRGVKEPSGKAGPPQMTHRDHPADPHPPGFHKDPQVGERLPAGAVSEPQVTGGGLQVAAIQLHIGAFLLHDECIHAQAHQLVERSGIKLRERGYIHTHISHGRHCKPLCQSNPSIHSPRAEK